MQLNITIPQLLTIHQVLREAEDKIFDGTGHRLNLFIEETEITFGITTIVTTVADILNIPLYAILSESRQSDVKVARQISIWLVKQYMPGITNGEIARTMKRDRTTVIHTMQYVNDRISTQDDIFLNKLHAAEVAVKKAVYEAQVNTK